MTSIAFLLLVTVMAGAIVGVSFKFLRRSTAQRVLLVLSGWLVYVGVLGYFGVIGNVNMRPPGLSLVLLPVLLFVAWLAWSDVGLRLAIAVPMGILLGLQTYRIAVELFLHQLYSEGIVPRMLTYEGANFDILIGLTAPLAAWAWTRGRAGKRFALIWNVVGLLALSNVVVRFVLTTPGPTHLIRTASVNLAASTFPYMYLPGFLAALALVLHVLGLRALIRRPVSSTAVPPHLI
jgi:hypothetical protein